MSLKASFFDFDVLSLFQAICMEDVCIVMLSLSSSDAKLKNNKLQFVIHSFWFSILLSFVKASSPCIIIFEENMVV